MYFTNNDLKLFCFSVLYIVVGCFIIENLNLLFHRIKMFILIKKGKLLMQDYKIKYSIDGKTYERVLRDTSLICCLNEFLERYPEVHVFECEEIS